jgi:hypothetical protein
LRRHKACNPRRGQDCAIKLTVSRHDSSGEAQKSPVNTAGAKIADAGRAKKYSPILRFGAKFRLNLGDENHTL